ARSAGPGGKAPERAGMPVRCSLDAGAGSQPNDAAQDVPAHLEEARAMTPRRIRSDRFHAQVAALLLAIVAAAPIARAAGVPKPEPTAPAPGRAVAAPVGLPAYQEPAAYSVDMLIHSPKADMVMKRFIDGK